MASKLFANEILSKNGVYQIFDASEFDANNSVSISEKSVDLKFSQANTSLTISQSGTGDSLKAGNFVLDASGSVTSGTLSSSVNFPTGHMKLLDFSQIGYGAGLTMNTIVHTITVSTSKTNSKIYLTGFINLERISADTTDSAQLSVENMNMTNVLVDGAVSYGAADSQNIHIPFAALTGSITGSTTFNIRLHDFTGTAEFNVNGGTVTLFEIFS